MSLNHIFQDTFHIGIKHLHGQFTILGCLEDGLILSILSRLQHVVACQHSYHGIITSIPVADVHSLPAPLVTNDGGQQFMVLYSVRAIQLIIRGHDGPRVALLHHNLKSLEIDFTKGTLRYL